MKRPLAWLMAVALAGIAFTPHSAPAQLLQQPVKIVFPFAPGGGGDALARMMAEELRTGLNRNVVVENKTGGAGQVGVLDVVNAAPNGDTLLITPIAPVVVYQNVYKNLKYDPFKDLKPVSLIADFEFAIAVAPNVPVERRLPELVAWLRANPKQANFGTPGAGTLPHFFGILFGKSIGVDINHVAYRGSALALVDLIAGQIPIVVTTTTDLLATHQGGKIRELLATSDSQRSPLVKDVPTFKEMGHDIMGTAWYAISAPGEELRYETVEQNTAGYSRIRSRRR